MTRERQQPTFDEVKILQKRNRNLTSFMEVVAKETKCLPDYVDSLPDGGNNHIIRKIQAKFS